MSGLNKLYMTVISLHTQKNYKLQYQKEKAEKGRKKIFQQ